MSQEYHLRLPNMESQGEVQWADLWKLMAVRFYVLLGVADELPNVLIGTAGSPVLHYSAVDLKQRI